MSELAILFAVAFGLAYFGAMGGVAGTSLFGTLVSSIIKIGLVLVMGLVALRYLVSVQK